MTKRTSYVSVTDQFCGAGGSSSGAERVNGVEVRLALNHWELAILTHNTNFPHTHHDCADISAADPRRYPSTTILITSPECTNHSVAKGQRRPSNQLGLFDKVKIDPAAERSRATMWDVPRFAEYHDYQLIIVENVVDARRWRMWDAWILAMKSLGYESHIVYFNSMFAHLDPTTVTNLKDFAPQSRDRMYVVFWKRGNNQPDLEFQPKAYCDSCEQVVEAVQVWKSTKAVRQSGGRWGRYKAQYIYACPTCSGKQAVEVVPYYFAAANAIDWSLSAERIGDRDRPLKAKTLARIKRGLERFGDQYLVLELAYGHAANNRARPLSGELFTQSTRQSQGLVLPRPFLTVNYSPGYSKDIEDTLASITATDHHALVVPPAFLTSVNDFDDRNISVERPMGTQTTQEKWGVTIPPFMITLRRHHGAKGIDEPLDTIVAGGNHHGLIMPAHFLMSYYGRGASHRGLEEVMGTLTGNDKHALVQSPFLLGYANGSGPAKSAVDELRTIHTENGQSVVQPDGFNVDDCSFRMLQPHEVGRGMAFSDDYVVLGTKREQVRQYGNAVTPPVMQMLIERCVETLR